MSEIFTLSKVPKGSAWRAHEELCGGTRLKALEPPDDDLAKVRFSAEVFEVLKKKRIPGETVREAIERIILAA